MTLKFESVKYTGMYDTRVLPRGAYDNSAYRSVERRLFNLLPTEDIKWYLRFLIVPYGETE